MKLAAFFTATAYAVQIIEFNDPWFTASPQWPDYFDKPANYRIAALKCGPKEFCDKFMLRNITGTSTEACSHQSTDSLSGVTVPSTHPSIVPQLPTRVLPTRIGLTVR